MTPDDTALLRERAALLGVPLTDDALARIDCFLGILAIWNRRLRLTGERDRRTIVVRHVVDSLAPARWLPREGLVIDIGSGAGFPGIVLACLRPDLSFALIEARRRRASFLADAIRSVPLPGARVVAERVEQVVGDPDLAHGARVVITRAVGLHAFLDAAAGLVAPDGAVIAMQTPGAREMAREVAERRGFVLADAYDYDLPDARKRSLLRFTLR